MNKRTRRQERGTSPTTTDSQAQLKTQDARGPNGHRVKFHHPVTVLQDRVWTAWQSVSGLGDLSFHHGNDRRKCWDSYGEPAQQALRLASSAGHGCGRWLRYGLGQRAGVFETELREVLRELESWIGVVGSGMNTPDDVRRRWKDNVAKLEPLLNELDNVAVDPKDLGRWYDELRACHGALTAVDQGMGELCRLAAKAADSLKDHLDHLLTHLIPSFRESLAVVLPGLSYAHNRECDAAYLYLNDLPSRLQRRAEDVARWGMRNAELGVTSEDRAFQAKEQLATTCEEIQGLRDYLERVLQELRLADTSDVELREADKLSATREGEEGASGAEVARVSATPWKPPSGFVGVKTIMSDKRFQKKGKNPPRTTIDAWIKRAERAGKPIPKEKAADSQEVHVPENWVQEQIRSWNPQT